MTKAETGVMQLQAKESRGLSDNQQKAEKIKAFKESIAQETQELNCAFYPPMVCNLSCYQFTLPQGFPDVSEGKEFAWNAGNTGGMTLILGWEDLLEEEMATHFSILA